MEREGVVAEMLDRKRSLGCHMHHRDIWAIHSFYSFLIVSARVLLWYNIVSWEELSSKGVSEAGRERGRGRSAHGRQKSGKDMEVLWG